ncbi:uncharacterized protein LOC104582993 [Brachypodium distachyon]|uniref:uncharacterized protein LOC104582993 n=1 Tax=Brachypodium distachyon TaxID=15368 RepID=UPI00052FE903|nr:uncharacterized protein LOC104582993 [Brachypodium distachyon]|eukprot:XP_010232935.1 uncharacterized protein LOC104582993 [Brachypodium distachyon]
MGSTDKEADDATSDVESTEEECSCPEPECAFEGGPTPVLEHLEDAHARPIDDVKYGQPWNFMLPLSRPWHVATGLGEDDGTGFFVTQKAAEPGGGMSTGAVSLICVRDAARTGPRPLYRCKMTLESLRGDKKKKNRVTTQASVCDRMHLEVPQEMMLARETLAVSIEIEKFLPGADTHGDNASGSVPRPKRTRKLPARLKS